MNAKPEKSSPGWVDPDDATEWTEDQLERAEFAIGGVVVRPAKGTLTQATALSLEREPKEDITLPVDRDVADALRSRGQGWQSHVNALLRDWLDLGQSR